MDQSRLTLFKAASCMCVFVHTMKVCLGNKDFSLQHRHTLDNAVPFSADLSRCSLSRHDWQPCCPMGAVHSRPISAPFLLIKSTCITYCCFVNVGGCHWRYCCTWYTREIFWLFSTLPKAMVLTILPLLPYDQPCCPLMSISCLLKGWARRPGIA